MSTCKAQPPRHPAGFTLLEMLVVLALMSLLLVVLTGTVSLGISARARITAVAADQQDFSSFQRLLHETLGYAYPDFVGTAPAKHVDMDGGPSYLQYVAPALQALGPGLARYDFSVQDLVGRKAVLLRTAMDDGQASPSLTASFAAGLTGLKFTYFGMSPDGRKEIWQDDWTMRTTPPELVAVQVTFPIGDKRRWPEIVVQPEIEADITCRIDPETHGCLGR